MTPEEAYYKVFDKKPRLQELESVILQDARFSYYYAKNIIKGKWEEGEAIIATNAY